MDVVGSSGGEIDRRMHETCSLWGGTLASARVYSLSKALYFISAYLRHGATSAPPLSYTKRAESACVRTVRGYISKAETCVCVRFLSASEAPATSEQGGTQQTHWFFSSIRHPTILYVV